MDSAGVTRMTSDNAVLLIIDIQERLAPSISGIEQLMMRNNALVKASKRLNVPIIITEQYPKGLGYTDCELKELAEGATIYEKIHFGASDEPQFRTILNNLDRKEIVITGTEAHVCVLQTALGLCELGYKVWFCADAVGSRTELDKDMAIKRVETAGISVVTTEMVLFEWLNRAGSAEFIDLLPTIKELAIT